LLLFTAEGKVVLLKRGKKARDAQGQFEGVGGGLDDHENDLIAAIEREVKEEIGDVEVIIDQTLGVKILPGESHPWWVVVDYVGRLISGTPKNMEPHKAEGVYTFTLQEVKDLNISIYQKETMRMYQERFGDKPYYITQKSL
jgi:8-oxo-dGTP pyrophosphatase MutT (NUDIX family)